MTAQKVFMTYSRQQFYFAESLATTLNSQHGIEAWFDSHNLTPGMDWSTGIDAGLTLCDVQVIIVSKQALESKYCRYEWETMRAAGKPIVIALFERVELPDDLRGLPIIDLRGNFEAGAAKLARVITGTENTAARIEDFPHVKRSNGVKLLLSSYTIVALLSLFPLVFPIIVIAYGRSRLRRKLLSRAYTYQEMINNSTLLATISVIPFGIWMMSTITPSLARAFPGNNTLVIGVGLLIGGGLFFLPNLLYRILFQYSADLLRWAPTGQASERLRNRVNRRARSPQAITFADQGKHYRLYYVPSDRSAAQRIRTYLDQAHYHEATDPAHPVDHQIVILSSCTPLDFIKQVDQLSGKIVTIFASTLPLPTDLVTLSKYQWVDYRTRSRKALQNLVEDLYFEDTHIDHSNSVLNPIPESYGTPMVPPVLAGFTTIMTVLLAAILGFGALVGGLLPVVGETPTVSLSTVLGVGAGFPALWVLRRSIAARSLPFIPVLILYLIGCVSLINMIALGVGSQFFIPVILSAPFIWLALVQWMPVSAPPSTATVNGKTIPIERFPTRNMQIMWIGAAALSVAMLIAAFVM